MLKLMIGDKNVHAVGRNESRIVAVNVWFINKKAKRLKMGKSKELDQTLSLSLSIL
jgi:hypothetical protein